MASQNLDVHPGQALYRGPARCIQEQRILAAIVDQAQVYPADRAGDSPASSTAVRKERRVAVSAATSGR